MYENYYTLRQVFNVKFIFCLIEKYNSVRIYISISDSLTSLSAVLGIDSTWSLGLPN